MKAIFTPFSIGIGLAAGIVAQKLFDFVWSKVDDEDAPDPKFRRIDYKKLIPALILQGAILRLTRGFVDHGLRHAFSGATGLWPGEEEPQPE